MDHSVGNDSRKARGITHRTCDDHGMTDSAASIHSVLPVLAYVDPDAAIPWLCQAFRFQEESRMVGADGKIAIASVCTHAGARIMIGGMPRHLKERFAALLSEREAGVVTWPDSITV